MVPQPEPIPLRTLTTLLQHELFRTSPLLNNHALLTTSVANPAICSNLPDVARAQFPGLVPASVKRGDAYFFLSDIPSGEVGIRGGEDELRIHPTAAPEVQNLTRVQKELIYLETRAQNGCGNAVILYDMFIKLFPPGQMISFRLPDHETIFLDPNSASALTLKIHNLTSMVLIQRGNADQSFLGLRQDEFHIVLSFPLPSDAVAAKVKPGDNRLYPTSTENHPIFTSQLILDPTLIQYGPTGRGANNEPYFLGSLSDFISTLSSICSTNLANLNLQHIDRSRFVKEELAVKGGIRDGNRGYETGLKERLEGCTERAWRRWENRGRGGWCEVCGRGEGEAGDGLMKCGRCGEVKYCCRGHQVAGWKVHRRECGVAK